ncbi:MAG: putative baseplate assembly protein [Massilia sp.]
MTIHETVTPGQALACARELRRQALFGNAHWNGMDYLEVGPDQRSLCVHFFGAVPRGLGPRNLRIEGGRRVRGIRVLEVEAEESGDPERDGCLRITLDRFGDFSTYRLCLVDPQAPARPPAGFDPRYACLEFSFKIDCPSPFDCQPADACPPAPPRRTDIDYVAKDYDSFRRLLLERLTRSMPDWRERHVPDLGVTLAELLAYSADMLSYYQDAVATEAYLETARRRVSVRRHVRLLDYRLHDGCNARAWLALTTDTDLALPPDVSFATGSAALASVNGSHIVPEAEVLRLPAGAGHLRFLPLLPDGAAGIDLVQAHNAIGFYTWGDSECCLARGATRATLLDEAPDGGAQRVLDRLREGDVLVFEEVLGPASGAAPDRDPAHRHAVRLTSVERAEDGLLGHRVLEIGWAPQDALPFALCLSARLAAPDCRVVSGISIARGNVVLVEHGVAVDEDLGVVEAAPVSAACACEGSLVDATALALPFRPQLRQAPLAHSEPLAPRAPAAAALVQDPQRALPRIWLEEAGTRWEPRHDLLASGRDARHFVAEVDDDGAARLRFGDGDMGRAPAPGASLRAHYLAGNGVAGNVPAETITYLVWRTAIPSGAVLALANPMAARGGLAAQPAASAKQLAPYAFRTVAQRAVTAQDYADLAQRDPRIQRADAHLRWTGSWYEARVDLDPFGQEQASPALRRAIARQLYRYRRMGHDLAVRAARYVPLALTLRVCVRPHYLRGQVAAALAAAFSNRLLAGGRPGFFHPDRLGFGGTIAVSALVGAAHAVDGVDSVCVAVLQRLDEPARGEVAAGLLRLAPGEIAQLDNDPDFPERGKLILILQGGL